MLECLAASEEGQRHLQHHLLLFTSSIQFHVVKSLFRHKKTRYKGLAKNGAEMFGLFDLANLVIAKKRLLALPPAQGTS